MKRPKSFILRSEVPIIHKYLMKALPLDGDIAECGVAKGGTSRRLILWSQEEGYNKTVHMFDYFSVGEMPDLATEEEKKAQESFYGYRYNFETFRETVKSITERFNGLELTNYVLHPGLVSDTCPKFNKPLCFIHADVDLYAGMKVVGEMAERLLVKGGYYIAHDYNSLAWIGAKQATDEMVERGTFEMVEKTPDGHGQCVLRKL